MASESDPIKQITPMPKVPHHSPNAPRGLEKGVDVGFQFTTAVLAWIGASIVVCVTIILAIKATEGFKTQGLAPIITESWNPQVGEYGIASHIKGTLYTSFLALTMATIFGLAVAIFISEDFLPVPLRLILKNVVELLAAIPSVIYGLWGIVVIIPLLRAPSAWLHNNFGWIPLFSVPSDGPGIFPASVVLAIMILPTITALSRDALVSVPRKLQDGSYALGATRWETIFKITLPTAATGIFAAVILALGRALGETMALAMLVGNTKGDVGWALFANGKTMASHLAQEFKEADGLKESMLMYVALVLMVITLLVNIIGSYVVRRALATQKGIG